MCVDTAHPAVVADASSSTTITVEVEPLTHYTILSGTVLNSMTYNPTSFEVSKADIEQYVYVEVTGIDDHGNDDSCIMWYQVQGTFKNHSYLMFRFTVLQTVPNL